MDGNGRWAQRRNRPRVFGHIRGASRISAVVREADRLGVKALTLYAFSTENWTRPEDEKSVLWKLLIKFLKKEETELARQNVRLRVIGEVDRLSAEVRASLDPAIARLSKNTGLQLTFAVSYGSRREILRAAEAFARDCREGRRDPAELEGKNAESVFASYLWTGDLAELADVDLVVRTSGEVRVSNFLLWQSAYAEYTFIEKCWPDFTPDDLRQAVETYTSRDRRFGGVQPSASVSATN
ncbi:MAG: di-trans,poly-cis-decaprenylcistransferase [Bdellovibrionales bacterium]|nr:di-trans,poly-cis-decaprenylcistransferase [Bdellovibrionales bacterium]